MFREAVQSTNIRSVGYEEATETLEVEFVNGSIYQYVNVPVNVHAEFMYASSKGRFHHLYIKDSYAHSRIW